MGFDTSRYSAATRENDQTLAATDYIKPNHKLARCIFSRWWLEKRQNAHNETLSTTVRKLRPVWKKTKFIQTTPLPPLRKFLGLLTPPPPHPPEIPIPSLVGVEVWIFSGTTQFRNFCRQKRYRSHSPSFKIMEKPSVHTEFFCSSTHKQHERMFCKRECTSYILSCKRSIVVSIFAYHYFSVMTTQCTLWNKRVGDVRVSYNAWHGNSTWFFT